MELVRERELELAREGTPVVRRERVGAPEDLVVVGRLEVAPDVRAPEPEPAGDRDLLRGQLEQERTAAVFRRRLPLDELEQLVRDDRPRDPAGGEDLRRPGGEGIDVREYRHAQLVQLEPAEKLVVLARVVADLVDHERGAVLDLLA